MIPLKSSKSKSSSKGIGKSDIDGYIKSISYTAREEYKRINNISLSKNIPSKQLFRQNKQNSGIEKDYIGTVNNSDYIKSLYKKYLGKDSDVDKGERNLRNLQSQSNIKQLKDNSLIHTGLSKLNSYRESASKPTRSISKKQIINYPQKQRKSQTIYYHQMLQLCDKQDSCVKATILLRDARKRKNIILSY